MGDYVKTQVQKMKPDPVTGELPFKGPVDCAMQQVKIGGITRLWTGFPTYYVRIAPHAMITLIAQDNVKKLWSSLGIWEAFDRHAKFCGILFSMVPLDRPARGHRLL